MQTSGSESDWSSCFEIWYADLQQTRELDSIESDTMAAIEEVNMPEQNENDPCLEDEKTAATNQTTEIKVEASQEEKTAAVQLPKRESWPNKPKKTRDEVTIQKLQELSGSQKEEIANLQRQIVEAMEALARERQTTKELCVEVLEHKKTVTEQTDELKHIKREMNHHKKEKESVIAKFSKTEEEKSKITEKLRLLNKDGCSINRTLKEQRIKTQKFTRLLVQAQKGARELQNEAVELHSAAFKLQNKVAALRADNAELKETSLKQQFEIQLCEAIIRKMSSGISSMAAEYEKKTADLQNQLSECKYIENEYKLELEETTVKLEKSKKDNQTILQRFRAMKAASDKKGKIVQANKEKKAEMREAIDILEEDREVLKNKLNSGFIGRYRQMKRFFVRLADTLLCRTAY